MPPASNNLNVKNGKVKMPVQWIDTTNNRIYYPNGNVGIGTNNPQNNLSVVGTTSTTTLLADNINTSNVYFPETNTSFISDGIINKDIDNDYLLKFDISANSVTMNNTLINNKLVAGDILIKNNLVLDGSLIVHTANNLDIKNRFIGVSEGLSKQDATQVENNKRDSGIILYRTGDNTNAFIGHLEGNNTEQPDIFAIGYCNINTKFNGNLRTRGKNIIPGLVYADISGSSISYFRDIISKNIKSNTIQNSGKITSDTFEFGNGTINDLILDTIHVSKNAVINGKISSKEITCPHITGDKLSVIDIKTTGLEVNKIKATNIDTNTLVTKDISNKNTFSTFLIKSESIVNSDLIDTERLKVKGTIDADTIKINEGDLISLIVGENIYCKGSVETENVNVSDTLSSQKIKASELDINDSIKTANLSSNTVNSNNINISENITTQSLSSNNIKSPNSILDNIQAKTITSNNINVKHNISTDNLTVKSAELNTITIKNDIKSNELITNKITSTSHTTKTFDSKSVTTEEFNGKQMKSDKGRIVTLESDNIKAKNIKITDNTEIQDLKCTDVDSQNIIVSSAIVIPDKFYLRVLTDDDNTNSNSLELKGHAKFTNLSCSLIKSIGSISTGGQLSVGKNISSKGKLICEALEIGMVPNANANANILDNKIKGNLLISHSITSKDFTTTNILTTNIISSGTATLETLNVKNITSKQGINCLSIQINDSSKINKNLHVGDSITTNNIVSSTAKIAKLENTDITSETITSKNITNSGSVKTGDINATAIVSNNIRSREGTYQNINTTTFKTTDLTTDTFKSTSIEVQSGKITNIEGDKLTVSEFVSKSISGTDLTIQRQINTNSIKCNNLETKTLSFNLLSGNNIKSTDINSVNITTSGLIKTPTIETSKLTSEECTINKIANTSINTNEIKSQNINSESIVVRNTNTQKITAQNIVSNDIEIKNKIQTVDINCSNGITSKTIKTDDLNSNNHISEKATINDITNKNIQTETLRSKTITAPQGNFNNILTKKIKTDNIVVENIENTNLTNQEITSNNISTDDIEFVNGNANNLTIENIDGDNIQLTGTINSENIIGKKLNIEGEINCNGAINCSSANFKTNIMVSKDINTNRVRCVNIETNTLTGAEIIVKNIECLSNIKAKEITSENKLITGEIKCGNINIDNSITSKSIQSENINANNITNNITKTQEITSSTLKVSKNIVCNGEINIGGKITTSSNLTVKGETSIGGNILGKSNLKIENGSTTLKELNVNNNTNINGTLTVGKNVLINSELVCQNISCKDINCANINAPNSDAKINRLIIEDTYLYNNNNSLQISKPIITQNQCIYLDDEYVKESVNINNVVDLKNTRFIDSINKIKVKQFSDKSFGILPDELIQIPDLLNCVSDFTINNSAVKGINYNSFLSYQIVALQYLHKITKKQDDELVKLEKLHKSDLIKINRLTKQIEDSKTDYNGKITELKKELSSHDNRFQELTDKYDEIIKNIKRIEGDNANKTKNITSLEQKTNTINNQIRDIQEHVGL